MKYHQTMCFKVSDGENFYLNHGNLPTQIYWAADKKIDYIYNAAGQKVKKTVFYSDSIKIVDYLDGFQYAGNILQFFQHAEGYVKVTPIDRLNTNYAFNYVFNYTDHLGNVRLSYSKDPRTNQLKILEENHYYPFGLKHSVYAAGRLRDFEVDFSNPEGEHVFLNNVTKTEYQYKYNGKEWQDELDLNMYAMDMRQYDPAIGRWVAQDPVIHHSMSPYNAFDNNPVFWADPSGANSVFDQQGVSASSITVMGSGMEIGAGGAEGGISKTGVSENTPKPLVATLTTEMIVTTTDTGDIVSSSSTFSVTNAANKSVYLPPVFIGFSIEIALPDLFNPGKYIGFGLSGGFIADADNNLDFFLTEKTLQNNKTPALQAAAGFEFGILIPQSNNSYVNNNSISGDGYETSGGIGFVGGSYGQDASGTYHQVGINGPGTSLEVGFANWNTSTNTMRLYNGGN